MKTEELKALWLQDTNQYYADCRIFKHIESGSLLLFKELVKDWLHYEVDSFSKDLFENLKK
jgi:hypothetical protein